MFCCQFSWDICVLSLDYRPELSKSSSINRILLIIAVLLISSSNRFLSFN